MKEKVCDCQCDECVDCTCGCCAEMSDSEILEEYPILKELMDTSKDA